MVTWTGFTSATPGLVPESIVTSTVNEAPAATGSFGGAASAVERGFGKSRGHREAGEEDARFKAWESSFANRHRRTDIKRIMILGAGPIVIGQARAAPPAQGSGVQLLTGRRAKPRRLPRR